MLDMQIYKNTTLIGDLPENCRHGKRPWRFFKKL